MDNLTMKRLQMYCLDGYVTIIPFLYNGECRELLLTKYTERVGNRYIWYDKDMFKRFVFDVDEWVIEDWYTGNEYKVGKFFCRKLKEDERIGFHYYGED